MLIINWKQLSFSTFIVICIFNNQHDGSGLKESRLTWQKYTEMFYTIQYLIQTYV